MSCLKKIPNDVHSLLCASNQINNYNRAVEELVYNALDAEATSIAIRINIQENKLQVIDNGCGVSSKDCNSIGHRNMTSKATNFSTLKSAPNIYGFRGLALASIIKVSKNVIITSRNENSEDTWMKLFKYGKEKLVKKCALRPSKGTTVEVTGFLYNLNMQNKSKDGLGNLNSIKTFLEHLSLIHCKVSLSLRDDSKNEIMFKMHKNRNIYQTLSTLYNMDKNYLQEFQVEKNEYKVTAYFGKSDEYGRHIIFLNGKCISNCASKLHKIVNNNLSKYLNARGIQKSKMKNMNTEDENNWIQTKNPDYLLFIKCPYQDYDMSSSPKQSLLEFRDWEHINNLLDKLVKFRNGDMTLKNKNEVDKKQASNKVCYGDTREHIKNIMEKILGAHSKKPGISHMHNAIKGKHARRIRKKPSLRPIARNIVFKDNGVGKSKSINEVDKMAQLDTSNNCQIEKSVDSKTPNQYFKHNDMKSCLVTNTAKKCNMQLKKDLKNNKLKIQLRKTNNKIISKKKRSDDNKDALLKRFEMETNSVKKLCDNAERRSKYIIEQLHKTMRNMTKDNVKMNTIPKTHINISGRKQIDEIIIPSNTKKTPGFKLSNAYKDYENLHRKLVKSNYDLLQTILKTQKENSVPNNAGENTSPQKSKLVNGLEKMVPETKVTESITTFKSHNYYTHSYNTEKDSYYSHLRIQNANQRCVKNRSKTFITKQSRDNFKVPNDVTKKNKFKKKNVTAGFSKQMQSYIKKMFRQTSKLFNMKKQIMENTGETSYTIEFTESNSQTLTNTNNIIMTEESKNSRISIDKNILPHLGNPHFTTENQQHIFIDSGPQRVDNNGYTINDDGNWGFYSTYTIAETNEIVNNTDSLYSGGDTDGSKNKINFIFVSKSQELEQNEEMINPITICQTVLHSLDREFEISFNDKQDNLSWKFDNPINFQNKCDDLAYGSVLSKENKVAEELNVQTLKAQCHMNENSHYFSPTIAKSVVTEMKNPSPIFNSRQVTNFSKQPKKQTTDFKVVKDSNLEGFNIVNRFCFLPKGMSPILQNCQTKNDCNYNLSRDYYEQEIYKNFAVGVRNNAEIFQPKISDAKENVAEVDKVNVKLTRHNAGLKFDGKALKDAKVLEQIDEKFIAVTMRERSCETATDYLVLFDQHAVHERIRLESTLSEYFNENQWKPVNIDAVSLTLPKDDVLYLHNYMDKFEQLGLQWTVTSTEQVYITAIPEAILGKNPRQPEKVIKAVKDLIAEVINFIKIQGGCVSLYPKSIMDLVFSEACRYAIKFGDKLSKRDCVELLRMLSGCKTPYQCAHGRPVMAVIMENRPRQSNYKVNFDKILEWRRKL